jgi:hypothetical protein
MMVIIFFNIRIRMFKHILMISLRFLCLYLLFNAAKNDYFLFFEGLIPEGWLLDIASKNWKLNRNDPWGYCWLVVGIVLVQ